MKKALVRFAAFAALAFAAPGITSAQIQQVDPDTGAAWQPYDAPGAEQPAAQQQPAQVPPVQDAWPETPAPEPQTEWAPIDPAPVQPEPAPAETAAPAQTAAPAAPIEPGPVTQAAATVPREDIFHAAEDLFGQGAEGLAGILEDILKDQGEPIAYISGREAGGAFILGVRYGSGIMRHRIEGDREVYWTGPSIGFDVGADASKVFVLVYNLYDGQQLFRSYASGEGRAYLVGGFSANYMRRGDVVLIPVRMGVGLRLGVNAGYMRFSEKNRWLPF